MAKAEWTKDEANPRFVVTSLSTPKLVRPSLTRDQCKARYLYEKVYCARGDMENRIKECQLDLYADRTSTATLRANQLRLWFATMAYVLLCALRRIGLHHTPFAKAPNPSPSARCSTVGPPAFRPCQNKLLLFFETFDVDAAAGCGKGSVFGGVGRELTCS